ncbi:Retrovirus-related Pol polyprotein from transposon TNT 1-94 [Gossypium australe]|uniref:Retrovirus-related Pol polyprotein from transposon TNT 1-94 n=1 Tax=Gossypium australe TaxID=47621 RepID=A0A5B6W9D4_9ROSI|nr:Retrovirus-related Pol polyprotein from transposon TNT 1-94 [Gossypium australe]
MSSSGFFLASPPVFNGESCHIWVVKIKTYLQAFDLWEVVNANVESLLLRANPTVAQIKQHSDDRAKKYMSCIQNSVDFENPKMKELETVKQYPDKIMVVVNNIRLLGDQFSEARIVEKNKEELANKRSIKKVPLKPRADQPQAPLATKGKKLDQTSLREMEQEEDIHLAHIVKRSIIQKQTACTDLMCSARLVNRWAMLRSYTNHMALDVAIFKHIDKNFNTRVKVGNGHYIKAEGKGDVLIDTPSGINLVSNFLLVPKIDRNLLSIAQFLEKGYSVVFRGKKCLISDPNRSKLMSVTMSDRSFVVDWNKSSVSVYITALDESKPGIKGKQARLLFLVNRAWGVSEKLQLVHTNVCGPMKTQYLNGSRYFILSIDDCSRFCWVYFLKFKSEVASMFSKFKAVVETQSSCKLRTLSFWAEAVNTAVYLQNSLPTKALLEKTPFEASFGFKPSVSHLKSKGKPECTIEYLVTVQTNVDQNGQEIEIDHVPVRKTKPLSEVYEKVDIATIEPTCFEEAEAEAQEGWRQAMLDEMSMILKN